MIVRRRWLAALLAAALPVMAPAQDTRSAEVDSVPDAFIFLKNRTNRAFGCTIDDGGDGTSRAFQLAPGQEYYRPALHDTVRMTCGGVAYALSSGARYAIQPTPGGGYAIQQITP